MKTRIYMLLLLFCCLACEEDRSSNREFSATEAAGKAKPDSIFNKTRWVISDGKDYPYREKMLEDLVYRQQLKGLTKEELIEMLGEPDRSNKGFLYYRVAQKRLGLLPLHTTTLVIELSADSIVKSRRIHE